jgi:hypothetical protein
MRRVTQIRHVEVLFNFRLGFQVVCAARQITSIASEPDARIVHGDGDLGMGARNRWI